MCLEKEYRETDETYVIGHIWEMQPILWGIRQEILKECSLSVIFLDHTMSHRSTN